MARTTLATTNARIDSLESKLDRILAHLEPSAPAKPVRRTAKKTPAPTKSVTTKALCKATRLAFVAAAAKEGYDFQGWSTKAIAAFCVETGFTPKGFRIGEGYLAMFS